MTHHEVPFFVAVEGFARVLASVVVTHHRGYFWTGRAAADAGGFHQVGHIGECNRASDALGKALLSP